jgi:hypothetical protein
MFVVHPPDERMITEKKVTVASRLLPDETVIFRNSSRRLRFASVSRSTAWSDYQSAFLLQYNQLLGAVTPIFFFPPQTQLS